MPKLLKTTSNVRTNEHIFGYETSKYLEITCNFFLKGLHCLIHGHDMFDGNSLKLPFYAFVDSLKINLWDHKNLLIPHQF